MRNFVTYSALVACLILCASCNNAREEANTNANKKTGTSFFKKKPKPDTSSTDSDSLLSEDLMVNADSGSTLLSDTLPGDSIVKALPLPVKETDIDWESSEKADTLNTSQEEPMEEWFEESSGEEETEYIDYAHSDVALNKERILKTEILKVRLPGFIDERDSVLAVIEERMNLNPEKVSKQIVVEKWFSPVNYRGYKFNRKKLMLYGVDKETLVSIYYYLGEYYFTFNRRVYNLDETAKNTSFESVKDTALTNYLLRYEGKL